ncbi:carboxy methyl transferase for protein phosphatase 2A [Coemansia sp. RSA 1813]|nr:carboxy methyl transferase for protein phosphatase 2A [Coemansia sp. RSA 1646]KAJ1771162.1 carboxy methyl transferase for protein phosphatase 2A [Coemansia sp. RSA 1843]KAJ2087814.1 carboxy methyl transferase for protein phosphatase 2A [Coemansia sp. RSA 986]KAJ2212708.1 carboxy methyl transferase for protein phosphatase 2A [Coemansia sp. RSA 487]KAJ2567367.1 carboxy methyl transferase for protein phosphatase 2A [Coemansia sp. RSA 1813]
MENRAPGRRSPNNNSDAAVQETSNDAAVSRESAARLGYIDDPWIGSFVKYPQRRAPLINRGTYSRFHGIQCALKRFAEAIHSTQEPQTAGDASVIGQVVVLGAGMDTSFFLLPEKQRTAVRFFEIDFPDITAKKAATIWRKRALRSMLPADTAVVAGGTELHSNTFNLLAADLRDFESTVVPKLHSRGFDSSRPTLFISECVLIYLDPEHSDAILDWITHNVPSAGIITYEQILPDDRFGQMMIENLRSRGLELRGLHAYPTLESTAQRFLSRGWHTARAVDLADYHDTCVEPSERERLARIEFLDEWEEFRLLARHYAFTFACTSDSHPFTTALKYLL